MLYKHQPAPPQLRHRCRNQRCCGALKIPATNPRDAFCRPTCESAFYGCRCRVCETLFTRKTKRRIVCWRAKCRYQFKRHPERFYGASYPSSPVAHNEEKNSAKSTIKIGTKSGRGFCIIAGPEPPEINVRIPPDVSASKANQAFEEHWRKVKWHAAREKLIKRKTPPVNVIGGYRFPGAPKIDLTTPSHGVGNGTQAIPIGDGLDIPPFLDRASWIRRMP